MFICAQTPSIPEKTNKYIISKNLMHIKQILKN